MNLGLVITMYDEQDCVYHTLEQVAKEFKRIVVVQSREEPWSIVQQELSKHPDSQYILLSNLDTRTEEQRKNRNEPFDALTRSLCRNYATGFREMGDMDYVVAILGDTLILHMCGIREIIEKMGDKQVACSRPMGQNIHASTLTREQMADPNHPKGGRIVDDTNKDFMPHLFIVRQDIIPRLHHIEHTNPWAFEQIMGDAIGDATQYVFANNAFEYSDGIVYNVFTKDGTLGVIN